MPIIKISDPFARAWKDHATDVLMIDVKETDGISDGYHTFGELYDHRITLFIALAKNIWRYVSDDAMKVNHKEIWRSKAHHPEDQLMYDGWFVMGIGIEPGKQITYHLPLSRWDETNFVETLQHAPKWDGHTPADTIERLKTTI